MRGNEAKNSLNVVMIRISEFGGTLTGYVCTQRLSYIALSTAFIKDVWLADSLQKLFKFSELTIWSVLPQKCLGNFSVQRFCVASETHKNKYFNHGLTLGGARNYPF